MSKDLLNHRLISERYFFPGRALSPSRSGLIVAMRGWPAVIMKSIRKQRRWYTSTVMVK